MFRLYRIAGVLCKDLRTNKICDSICHSQYVENRVSANNTNVLYRTLHYLPCKNTPTLLRILAPSGNQPLALSSTKVFNTQAYLTRGIHQSQKAFNNGFDSKPMSQGTKSTLYYIAAVGVLALGLSYAAVPLYRIFCQAYSYGGTTQQGQDAEKVEFMEKREDRILKIRFNADTAASMTWNFKPQQSEIKVAPGETALAFYTARNPTDRPVIGVSTYNVIPFDAGLYFNKIQCFCFEEQLLNPHEEVHMPVFFYIDPEFADDPKMEGVDTLTLSYTFFEAREGVPLPIPNFARK
ncbi:cytochrome c oxidase assembly protein COX11, mitochondrial-like [Penaeus chinensis]|uniref:cytochrome c oxidase assembly protein COX11, mitochondrial-like n=1 Tax=Penaeus chinensis TaxID=139456 RepID=UPI001FB699FA|nr:cytochrome c oxidase assembly protein COX11, mitochondrial-like [Penaeus chinensis]